MNEGIDLLVFAPHPDDGEIGLGGTLALLARTGQRTAIVDLTRGEWGTKGTPEDRAAEAAAATAILRLTARENLDLGDGRLEPSLSARRVVAACLRRLRPEVVAVTHPMDRHPDHRAAAALVQAALMWARMPNADVPGEPCYPRRLLYYFIHDYVPPAGIIDVSQDYETKRQAVVAYRTQFVEPQLPPGYRYIGTSDYLRTIEARARHYGAQIGAEYGEAIAADGPLRVPDPLVV